jgi:hypothetical protein
MRLFLPRPGDRKLVLAVGPGERAVTGSTQALTMLNGDGELYLVERHAERLEHA